MSRPKTKPAAGLIDDMLGETTKGKNNAFSG